MNVAGTPHVHLLASLHLLLVRIIQVVEYLKAQAGGQNGGEVARLGEALATALPGLKALVGLGDAAAAPVAPAAGEEAGQEAA